MLLEKEKSREKLWQSWPLPSPAFDCYAPTTSPRTSVDTGEYRRVASCLYDRDSTARWPAQGAR